MVNKLREANPDMKGEMFFVPNRIDARIGTSEENRMWKQTDHIFKQIGSVTPRIASRATLKRINTYELLATQRDAVSDCFDFMLRKMK